MKYTNNLQLYKWDAADTKIDTIVEMSKNAEKIDAKLLEMSQQLTDTGSVSEKLGNIADLTIEANSIVEAVNESINKASGAETTSLEAKTTAEAVRSEFDLVVAEAGSSNPEVVLARGGEVNLGNRLNKVDAQLAETAKHAKNYLTFQNALNDAENSILILEKGKTYEVNNMLQMPKGCKIFGNGAIINMNLSGNVDGLRLNDNTTLLDLTVNVIEIVVATGSGQRQCPVIIGDYGSGVGHSNILIENVKVHSTRDNSNGIYITGDSHNITIRNITIPDSTTLARPILIHWGGADNPTAGTKHPHNIKVYNIKTGSLTQAGTGQATVFLSGVYDVEIDNVVSAETGRALVHIVAGDYGFYYAPEDVKPFAMRGITVKNAQSLKSGKFGFYVDGIAPLAPSSPIYDSPIIFERCKTVGNNAIQDGFYITNTDGVVLKDCEATKHGVGVRVDAGAKRTKVDGGKFHSNAYNGISVSGNGVSDTIIDKPSCFLNGASGTGSLDRCGVYVGNSKRTKVLHALLGDETNELNQYHGIRIDTTSTDAEILNCHVNNVKTSGVAYSLGSGTAYGILKLFRDNTAKAGITLKGGLLHVPVRVDVNENGVTVRTMIGQSAPTSGTWVRGDNVINFFKSEQGTAGSRYLIEGWEYITSWIEKRVLTGT